MLHDLALRLAEDPPPTDTPLGAILAIGGMAVALLGAITGLLTTLFGRHRRRRDEEDEEQPRPAPSPLNTNTATDGHASARDAHYAAVMTFMFLNHMNPNKIVTGNEAMTDVRFD